MPRELETIVLKAMGKNPTERYVTAQELADDLKRFLEDRPIEARRPTLVQRAAKWARRHRSLVAAALIVLVVTAVGSLLSTWLVTQAYEVERTAKEEAEALSAERRQHIVQMHTAAGPLGLVWRRPLFCAQTWEVCDESKASLSRFFMKTLDPCFRQCATLAWNVLSDHDFQGGELDTETRRIPCEPS